MHGTTMELPSQTFACKTKEIFDSCMKPHHVNLNKLPLQLL